MLPLSIYLPDILWSLNDVFPQKLTILQAIWNRKKMSQQDKTIRTEKGRQLKKCHCCIALKLLDNVYIFQILHSQTHSLHNLSASGTTIYGLTHETFMG